MSELKTIKFPGDTEPRVIVDGAAVHFDKPQALHPEMQAQARANIGAVCDYYSTTREELAVTLSVGDVFMDVIHEYPDLTVHLTLFNATIAEGEPQKLEHNDIQWITPSEIPNYEFCPADEEILKKIIEVHS